MIHLEPGEELREIEGFSNIHEVVGGVEDIGHFPTREEARAARDRFVQNGRT
jgi:hypothetical protein